VFFKKKAMYKIERAASVDESAVALLQHGKKYGVKNTENVASCGKERKMSPVEKPRFIHR
jgi:hypothetical protein